MAVIPEMGGPLGSVYEKISTIKSEDGEKGIVSRRAQILEDLLKSLSLGIQALEAHERILNRRIETQKKLVKALEKNRDALDRAHRAVSRRWF